MISPESLLNKPTADYENTVPGSRKINTFVFMDLETSDLLPIDKPKILELCMVAIHRAALCDVQQSMPRVLDKLTICFNPNKQVSHKSYELTGLDNLNIAESAKSIFDDDAVKLMQLFLHRQQQPVCLVAHNGDRFDFQLLRTELSKINQSLDKDILCADSLIGFYETDVEENSSGAAENSESDTNTEVQHSSPIPGDLKAESTTENLIHASPSKRIRMDHVTPDNQAASTPRQYTRIMPYSTNSPSYSLANIFRRTFNGQSLSKAHNAEGDVIGLIQVCKSRGEKLCQWMDRKAVMLSEVQLYYIPSPPRSSKRSLRF